MCTSIWENPPFVSKDEFVSALEFFLLKSESINDDWTIHDRPTSKQNLKKVPYLVKRNVYNLPPEQEGKQEWFRMDYHVVYSASYQMPVLYFLAYWSNNKPLSIDDIYIVLSQLDSCTEHHLVGIRETPFGGGISQNDHPNLGIPYFYLHPCNSASLLSVIFGLTDSNNESKSSTKEKSMHRCPTLSEYISAFLSFFGPPLGLVLERGYSS